MIYVPNIEYSAITTQKVNGSETATVLGLVGECTATREYAPASLGDFCFIVARKNKAVDRGEI